MSEGHSFQQQQLKNAVQDERIELPLQRLAVKWRKKKKTFCIGILGPVYIQYVIQKLKDERLKADTPFGIRTF